MNLHIRHLQRTDISPIAEAFAAIGWNKPASQYEEYLSQQEAGTRTVFVAFIEDEFAGYVTVNWHSDYPPFRDADIPEIQDFNVLPKFRRQGIGSRLMDAAEARVAEQSPIVGIGVGLYADYGAAQRMYCRRGYILDGRGPFYHDRFVKAGESVRVDDSLVLCFTKQLHQL